MVKKKTKTSAPPIRQRKNNLIKKSKLLSKTPFPIVGIGASAGGLEALKELLSNAPIDTGMAFIIIQHLDPKHESMSAQILARATEMPVTEIKDKMRVKANQVYVIPSNSYLGIKDGLLKLLPRIETNGQHLPLDFFLRALADERENQAIGVVLSGTASDGTEGLRAIKAHGGITLAQDPKSSKFDGMPRSAITAGVVDFISTPKGIAIELARIAKHPYIAPNITKPIKEPLKKDESLSRIFDLLRNTTNIDFTHYKINTIQRRIARRMLLQKTNDLSNYAKYLEEHPEEINALHEDILIHVTCFFRDKKNFETLKTHILPKYMKNRDQSLPFRIWVPGCSTGEEVYSLAMIFMEYQETAQNKSNIRIPLFIFGTDISEQALSKARKAIYPSSISEDISKERLQKFFEKVDGGGYRIAKWLRESCLFSKHDVISDPPFAKVDLISCRNLLIYFDLELQKHIFPIFHYALNPGGVLLLGKSETVGAYSNLFSLAEKSVKAYFKTNTKTPLRTQFQIGRFSVDRLGIGHKRTEFLPNLVDIQRESDQIALSEYAPPSVVINHSMEIVQSSGRTAPFLELSPGQPSLNVVRMAHPELVGDLRAAILAARKKNGTVIKECLIFRGEKSPRNLTIKVVPIPVSIQPKEQYFIIFFDESKDVEEGETGNKTQPKASAKTSKERELKDKLQLEMKKKLSDNQEYQQSLIEEYEASQEELVSSNEELQSTNEELQSTNEELETAKEELQSTNEELITANDDLQVRNVEMVKLNSDLKKATEDLNKIYQDSSTIIESQPIPLLVIDSTFHVKLANKSFYEKFQVSRLETEGTVVSELGSGQWKIPQLETLIEKTLIKGIMFEHFEVEYNFPNIGRRIMLLSSKRVQLIGSGEITALLVIEDVTERLNTERALRVSEEKYRNLIANAYDGIIIINENGLIDFVNHRLEKMFGYSLNELINKPVEVLVPNLFNNTHESDRIKYFSYLIANESGEHRQQNGNRKDGTTFPLDISLSAIKIERGIYVTAIIRDISELKEIEKQREQILINEQKANKLKDDFLATLSHELRTPLTPILAWSQIIRMSNFDKEKTKRGIEILERNAKSQSQLIDDLLDMTSIRAGKLNLTIQKIDPNNIINTVIDSTQDFAATKSIQIETKIDPSIKYIFADPLRLQQILWNLITNSIKFSSQGGKIWVELEHVTSSSGKYIQFKVRDAGKGIKPEFLPIIFERFSQADNSSTRTYGGLGLGLSIVENLVKMHKGTITAESLGEGKGATFTFLLPEKNFAKIELVKPSVPTVTKLNLLRDLSILVVEDNEDAREVIKEMVQSFGAEVKTAESANQALSILGTFNPDLLISDISMPDEDGYTLIRKLRGQNSIIPALALTAHANQEDIDQALLAGFQSHLAKPVDANTLALAIAQLVGRK